MGLLYLFPNSLDEEHEKDHLNVETLPQGGRRLVLKSYGLPILFWLYLLMILVVLGLMFALIQKPIHTLIQTEDPTNIFLGRVVLGTLALTPFFLLCFFFYYKVITKEGSKLILEDRLFHLPLRRKVYHLDPEEPFIIRHFLGSPNLARKENDEAMLAYMNRGYFELWGKDKDGAVFLIDRNSRKNDLNHLKEMLEQF